MKTMHMHIFQTLFTQTPLIKCLNEHEKINFFIKKFARAVKVELNFTNIFFFLKKSLFQPFLEPFKKGARSDWKRA